ncbi:response regulator transcription factor [Subtercola endophyticus]|uniref:response regulator transcription factor n=1 Tax=Subtercola endophyticus TaxID=2895559 RepID=UPI001E3445FB|nr:response regulator transcription factor [Subtercola endophyticus]UFS57834.1 response regulator transcription factor [Subtercola endophyticus]
MTTMDMSGQFQIAVIIEDSPDISGLIDTVLTAAGFRTVVTTNGLDGINAVREYSPVITTLDVNMPGIDGFETARRIRSFSDTYLIMLTARDDEIDTLQGLEAGADDYLIKPFRPRELRARIAAMQRRPRAMVSLAEQRATVASPDATGNATGTGTGTSTGTATGTGTGEPATGASGRSTYPREDGWVGYNGLFINEEMRLAEKDGIPLELTRSEFSLLVALVNSGRRVRSKTDLALLLRGESESPSTYVSESDKRAIEVHIVNLRRKLGDDLRDPRFIETVRGIGYRMAAAHDAS